MSFGGAILALCMIALPAHAQASRTWVSGVGDDANPCSRTAPCKTFASTISKTATNGEINCLDPGGYGAVTITKLITISCEAGTAGVLVQGTNAIVVNTPAGSIVYLRGLDIQGLTSGLSGISFTGAGVLHVEHCLIRGFNGGPAPAGITFASNGLSELYVSESYIADNGTGAAGGGIVIRPVTAGVNAVLSQVHLENNSVGAKADGSGGVGAVNLTVVDSISAGNTSSDIIGFTTAGHGPTNVMVNRSSLSASALGLGADGAASTVRIGNSVIFGNVTGVQASNGGTLQSYGNNQLTGNGTDGTPTATPLH